MNRSKISYRFSVIIGCLPFITSALFAQDQAKRDSSNIAVRYFKENITERYQGDEFNYSINDTGGVNLIQRIFQKFFGWLTELFGIDLDWLDYQTLEYIIYGLMAIGMLYLILSFLLQAPIQSVFRKANTEIDGFNFIEEDITEINFENLIESALSANNFRLATRYLYLKTLKSLANRNVINWHFDKTNSEYLIEISDAETKSLFKRISYIYDYVWYGEFKIDELMYNKNKEDFRKLAEHK